MEKALILHQVMFLIFLLFKMYNIIDNRLEYYGWIIGVGVNRGLTDVSYK